MSSWLAFVSPGGERSSIGLIFTALATHLQHRKAKSKAFVYIIEPYTNFKLTDCIRDNTMELWCATDYAKLSIHAAKLS